MSDDHNNGMNKEESERLTRLETKVTENFKFISNSLGELTESIKELVKESIEIKSIRNSVSELSDRVNLNEVHIYNAGQAHNKLALEVATVVESNNSVVWIKRTILGLFFSAFVALIVYVFNEKTQPDQQMKQLMELQIELLKEMKQQKVNKDDP